MAQVKLGQQMVRRLGDLLVAEGLITDAQLRQALTEQKGKTDKLGTILVSLGFITEEQLIGLLSRQYGLPCIRLATLAIDLHWEPYEKTFRIRFRIDGVLHEMLSPPKRLEPAIISRLKIMSNLDISERRLPQDGRIKLRYGSREIDFRVSVLPTIFGEKRVLRILDKESLQLDLTNLGFHGGSYEKFSHAIHQPY